MGSEPNNATPPGLSLMAVLRHVWWTFKKKPFVLYGLSYVGLAPLCFTYLLWTDDYPHYVFYAVFYAAYIFLHLIFFLVIAYAFELNKRRGGSMKSAAGRVGAVIWPLLAITLVLAFICQGAHVILPPPIPETLVAVFCVVVIPACLMEKLGIFDSFKRGIDLTRGSRLKIMLLVVAVYAINYYVFYPLIIMVWEEAVLSYAAITLLGNVFYSITFLFMYLAYAAIYYELRTIKDYSADNEGPAQA